MFYDFYLLDSEVSGDVLESFLVWSCVSTGLCVEGFVSFGDLGIREERSLSWRWEVKCWL